MSAQLNDLLDNKHIAPEDNPVLSGNFAPVDTEQTLVELEVVGRIPDAVSGTLLRNGPNPVNAKHNHHWFIGDGMVHAIEFADGKAHTYRNRWVRTTRLESKTDMKAAPVSAHELLMQGTGNVNVISHGGRILALSEAGLPYEMSAELDTVRMYDYDGKLASSMTAHPKVDGKNGELLFFGYDILPPYLRYHVADPEGRLTSTVDINLLASVMMHDFGVTATRVIFMDMPVVTDLELMKDGFGMPFRWDEGHKTRLGIMDRDSTSDTVRWIDIDTCYVFHVLNSYDDGDKIIMDVVRYERVFNERSDLDYERGTKLVRWTIDPAEGKVDSRVLSPLDQEFPRVNPAVECHPHRYGYCLQADAGNGHGFANLYKHDLVEGLTESHDVGDNCAGGEPIFVSSGEAEDEGYILSVVFNGNTGFSEVHIINAQQFTAPPVAVVKLNTRIPFGFHGNFVPS
ncbi:carotenoid oxygenase family protein [Parahaliea mediterranea]|uniref:Carotenoid oxygenase family protein n=1 Tax=Parahaliea mediterranea TaxID=651086 RepID=A0A939ILP1_9GAMM|nr:carotenoid oxygenase family protein [Parahaliea mediterranea]MBN7796172.1 carotenoid oxygenase family protein [Parahaliea mediterranea]